MKLCEDDLCRAFAETVRQSEPFTRWLLRCTKFEAMADTALLLHDEQVGRRPKVDPTNWWRHWWCKIPHLDRARETDIFLVFQDLATGRRFALHIENKNEAKFLPGQAEDYAPRARYMMHSERYLNYSDYATVLIAPASVNAANPQSAGLFDSYVSYEAIANFVPAFCVA